MMQGVIGVVLVVAIVAALLGFMATVMLTCIALAKTRLVTIFGYVVVGVLALVAVLSVFLTVVPGRGYWW